MVILLQDRYDLYKNRGEVIGSPGTSGAKRLGIDVESVLSIDNNALRVRPLLTPGWGRSGLVYGPFERQNGLTLSICLLNGHHASQTGSILQSFPGRILRWLRGSGTYNPVVRLIRWLFVGQKGTFFQQLRYWYKNQVWNATVRIH